MDNNSKKESNVKFGQRLKILSQKQEKTFPAHLGISAMLEKLSKEMKDPNKGRLVSYGIYLVFFRGDEVTVRHLADNAESVSTEENEIIIAGLINYFEKLLEKG